MDVSWIQCIIEIIELCFTHYADIERESGLRDSLQQWTSGLEAVFEMKNALVHG